MKNLLFLFAILLVCTLEAQTDSLKKWSFSVYGEIYYSYDFSNPENHEKPNFIYNHKRHNEFNANLLVAKAAYSDSLVRSNIGLMFGNYAQYNLASEPSWAQFVYEANIGVKLSKEDNVWLDAGILPSHLGFESAISADCQTLTRSILAENSPYYETGVRLSSTSKNEKVYLAAMVLNGWQKIMKQDGVQRSSFGLQFSYKPNTRTNFNYSNFIGSTKPDSLNALRVFHNFYVQYATKKRLAFTLGFDLGSERLSDSTYGWWHSPVAIISCKLNSKFKLAVRGEYYADKHQIVIPTLTINGFQVFGSSLNLDYKINDLVQFRIEGKMYHSKDIIFSDNSRDNYSLTSNLTIRL